MAIILLLPFNIGPRIKANVSQVTDILTKRRFVLPSGWPWTDYITGWVHVGFIASGSVNVIDQSSLLLLFRESPLLL